MSWSIFLKFITRNSLCENPASEQYCLRLKKSKKMKLLLLILKVYIVSTQSLLWFLFSRSWTEYRDLQRIHKSCHWFRQQEIKEQSKFHIWVLVPHCLVIVYAQLFIKGKQIQIIINNLINNFQSPFQVSVI